MEANYPNAMIANDKMVPGMVYCPVQKFKNTYEPQKALMKGTIFPELDKPFTGKMQGGKR